MCFRTSSLSRRNRSNSAFPEVDLLLCRKIWSPARGRTRKFPLRPAIGYIPCGWLRQYLPVFRLNSQIVKKTRRGFPFASSIGLPHRFLPLLCLCPWHPEFSGSRIPLQPRWCPHLIEQARPRCLPEATSPHGIEFCIGFLYSSPITMH